MTDTFPEPQTDFQAIPNVYCTWRKATLLHIFRKISCLGNKSDRDPHKTISGFALQDWWLDTKHNDLLASLVALHTIRVFCCSDASDMLFELHQDHCCAVPR